MKITAQQALVLRWVEVELGTIVPPWTGQGEEVTDRAKITLAAGESVSGILPGKWHIDGVKESVGKHPLVERRADGTILINADAIEGIGAVPLEIEGLMLIQED